LLYSTFDRAAPDATPSRSIRDLSVLVAEDPNYALLSGAARTIKNLLDHLITNKFTTQANTQPLIDVLAQPPLRYSDDELITWGTHGLQDFDPGFWLNLSEHPFLMTSEGGMLQ
jgi:hypothetical protein